VRVKEHPAAWDSTRDHVGGLGRWNWRVHIPGNDEMKNCYLSLLRDFGYPFDKFPNVVFEFDSDENVRKNYAGSYFYRLR
jgi:hypothetical protein